MGDGTSHRSSLQPGWYLTLMVVGLLLVFVVAALAGGFPIQARQFPLLIGSVSLLLGLVDLVVTGLRPRFVLPFIKRVAPFPHGSAADREPPFPAAVPAQNGRRLWTTVLLFCSGFAVFTVILWSIGEILVFPFITTFIAGRAIDANRGRFMGMYMFVFALSFVISPTYGMTIYDTFGPKKLWHITGLIGVGVWLGFLLIQRRYFSGPDKDLRD